MILVTAQDDVPGYMSFPLEHWRQLHFTKPHERLMREISRRADVVAIFPDRPSVIHLACALLAEQDDEWATGPRYFSVESVATLAGGPSPHRRYGGRTKFTYAAVAPAGLPQPAA